MRIRAARFEDIDSIARVHARAVVAAPHYGDALDEDHEFEMLRRRISEYLDGTHDPRHALPERAIFVAETGGEIVGFVAGHKSTRRGCTGELQWMFVLPEWQRKGVGARLLTPMRDWFGSHASTRVIIDAPPEVPTRAFYLKHGAVPLDAYWLYWPDITLVAQAPE